MISKMDAALCKNDTKGAAQTTTRAGNYSDAVFKIFHVTKLTEFGLMFYWMLGSMSLP
jgi:hypothetical protein